MSDRIRRVLLVTTVWAGVVAAAFPRFESPRRELVEAAVYLAWFIALAASSRVARLFAAAPRVATATFLLLLTALLYAHLAHERTALYPVATWYMYGESRRGAPVTGLSLQATACDGEIIPLDTDHLSVSRFRVNMTYNMIRTQQTAADSAEAGARFDNLLRAAAPKTLPSTGAALCTLTLMEHRVPSDRVGVLPLPPPVPVWHVTIR